MNQLLTHNWKPCSNCYGTTNIIEQKKYKKVNLMCENCGLSGKEPLMLPNEKVECEHCKDGSHYKPAIEYPFAKCKGLGFTYRYKQGDVIEVKDDRYYQVRGSRILYKNPKTREELDKKFNGDWYKNTSWSRISGMDKVKFSVIKTEKDQMWVVP